MCDFEFKTKMLDELIDLEVAYWHNDELDEEDLYEITNHIVDEWISDSGMNGYVFEELKTKTKTEIKSKLRCYDENERN